MCGIAGIRKFGKTPIRSWQITLMANRLEYRGNDATGVALMTRDGKTRWLKDHEPAWGFTSSNAYKTWLNENLTPDVIVALIHTRKWTKGSCFINANNHPIVMEKNPKGIIIHNGVITNDDRIFEINKENGFERACATDSDAIRALLDFHGGISKDSNLIKDLCALEGAVAAALIHPETPDKLLLLRDNNPLMVGGTEDFLFFASDKRCIHEAAKPFVRRHGAIMRLHAPGLAFIPMPNESAWIIGDKGIEWHEKFKCAGYNHGRGNTVYRETTDYHERRERARKQATAAETKVEKTVTKLLPVVGNPSTKQTVPDFVLCLGENCFRHIPITENERTRGLENFKCKECGTPLNESITNLGNKYPVVKTGNRVN